MSLSDWLINTPISSNSYNHITHIKPIDSLVTFKQQQMTQLNEADRRRNYIYIYIQTWDFSCEQSTMTLALTMV